MIYLVDTFGGGPVAAAHIVYIHLSDELRDLSIRLLSGRSDGKLLSSDSDRAIGPSTWSLIVASKYIRVNWHGLSRSTAVVISRSSSKNCS